MRLAIIHTTAATVEPLKTLAQEILPGCEVINLVDDSILPQLAQNGGDLDQVAGRWLGYARVAEEVGAGVILSACSSVGELVKKARQEVSVPVVRIDEAMAEEAVRRGRRIGVAATLETTLNPTLRLLQEKAVSAGREVELKPVLIEAAYQRLMAGDKDGHDDLLARALEDLASEAEVVVLAQASMARVLPRIPEPGREKFLSSLGLGMERVKEAFQSGHG
jgi:Asp/Glu/hydantoin racemase